MKTQRLAYLAGLLLMLQGWQAARAQEEEVKVTSYRIVLRARNGETLPDHNKDGQIAGGYLDVVQLAPNKVQFVMRGGVVAGSELRRPGQAALTFQLDQEFDIEPTRAGLKPPRLSLAGQLIGILESTNPVGGVAEQAPACAAVSGGSKTLLQFCIKPQVVTTGQKIFVNSQEAPNELTVRTGRYLLHQTFGMSANSPPPPSHQIFPRIVPAASAVFTTEAKFDTRWSYALGTFRSVPRTNFGFSVVLTVTESEGQLPAPAMLDAQKRD